MAIAVGTNSTTSPRQPVSLTTLSVSGHNTADLVESTSITKTPLTANSTVASSPYNTLAPSPVTNTTISVTKYDTSDSAESKSITKTPFGISVPFAWSSISSGGYSGADIVITEYADEYWITQ